MNDSMREARLEDGYRSIASKIMSRIHDLEKTVDSNRGRWAWELLQNAKDSVTDSVENGVRVRITLKEDELVFEHDGACFNDKDVRGLVSQTSSKEIEHGKSNKIGRFGTGFITTHLLSKKVQIAGILEHTDGKKYAFNFLLDRKAETISDLVEKIKNLWSEYETSLSLVNEENEPNLNTSFSYKLETDLQKDVARTGVQEFLKLAPFSLIFVPEILEISIRNEISGSLVNYKVNRAYNSHIISQISIQKGDQTDSIFLLHKKNSRVAIAALLGKVEGGFSVKNIDEYPKLFCNFPLIGTEDFCFPVVVNSFFFNPLTERDGIWLKGPIGDEEVLENQNIFIAAVQLYKSLLKEVSEESFYDLYNLANTKLPEVDEKYLDLEWYKNTIQSSLRDYILSSEIVETLDPDEKQAASKIFLPSRKLSIEEREKIWELVADIVAPGVLCKHEHIEAWSRVSWKEWRYIGYGAFLKSISKSKNIETLARDKLGRTQSETFAWLNNALEFILEQDSNIRLFKVVR